MNEVAAVIVGMPLLAFAFWSFQLLWAPRESSWALMEGAVRKERVTCPGCGHAREGWYPQHAWDLHQTVSFCRVCKPPLYTTLSDERHRDGARAARRGSSTP